MTFAVVRVRGGVRTRTDVRDTLRMLHLTRQNHLSFVPEDSTHRGMLQKVKDFVTWGEIDEETAFRVLEARGRLEGNRPLTEDYLKANTSYASLRELAAAIASSKASLSGLKGVKPVIRLHPPLGGYENTKKAFRQGGSLGYRGSAICSLILRMLGPSGGPGVESRGGTEVTNSKERRKGAG
ncbi:MAG: 50S ribosomal protein L30 [Thermoplasmata archaeon]